MDMISGFFCRSDIGQYDSKGQSLLYFLLALQVYSNLYLDFTSQLSCSDKDKG